MAVAQYAPSPPVVDQSGGGGGYQLAEQDYDGGEGDYADYSGYEDEMGGGGYMEGGVMMEQGQAKGKGLFYILDLHELFFFHLYLK